MTKMSSSPKRPFLTLTLVSVFSLASLSNAMLNTRQVGISSPVLQSFNSDTTCTTLYSSISQAKRKNRKKKEKRGRGRSISEEELNEHVSARYSAGGPLNEKARGIVDPQADQAKFLKELNSRPALLLNADFQPLRYLPLSLWSWQDAVKAIFAGKVQVVDVYPDVTIRAANLELPLPSVIALTDYVQKVHNRPAFTRRNVYLRDEYKCQYCNDRFHTADLSLDHVHPRCMGGQLTWENAVTCCLKCNGKKGSLPLSELRTVGMRLVREPLCPSQMEMAAKSARMVPRRVHPTWKPYLGIAFTPSSTSSSKEKTGDEEFIDDRYFEEEA